MHIFLVEAYVWSKQYLCLKTMPLYWIVSSYPPFSLVISDSPNIFVNNHVKYFLVWIIIGCMDSKEYLHLHRDYISSVGSHRQMTWWWETLRHFTFWIFVINAMHQQNTKILLLFTQYKKKFVTKRCHALSQWSQLLEFIISYI